jgi:DNA-binding NarL/FixJ family response regulator
MTSLMTRLLVVDDNDEVRRSLRVVLAELLPEAAVEEATGAGEALALLDRTSFDLVLLDLSLPDRKGMDMLRELRRLRPALPVVVMSFHPAADYAAAARAAGAAAYVAKGSPPQVIEAALRTALAAPPPHGRAPR